MKSRDRSKLRIKVAKVHEAVKDIHTYNITGLKSFLYVAAFVVTERMKMTKGKKASKNEEPFWKRRMKRNIKTKHKDLGKIEKIRKGNTELKKEKTGIHE